MDERAAILLLICLGAAAPVTAQTATERSDTLALTNVTVIDGTGAPPRPHMTVLVHGDRIGGIFAADEAPIPASAEVLDLSGRYLIPGLINTHIHLPMMGWTRDSAAAGLERMLRAGVTTVREMAGDTRLTAELNRASLVEGASLPNIHFAVRMAGPSFYEPVRVTDRAWMGYPSGSAPWAQAVTDETDMARAVAVAAGTGATGLKLYADLDVDVVRRLVAEAHRQGLKAWAHGTVFPTGPLDAVRAGIDGLSHACFLFWGLQPVVAASMGERAPFDPDSVDLDAGPFRELLREMRARNVVLDATARNASGNPGAHAAGCTPELLNRSLRAAHRAGVRMSTGTDYVIAAGDPDPTLFTEIEYLVDAGVLSPLEAITAATLNGARAIGIEDRYGTIEVGKVADLVVLSGDPTEGIGALQGVVAVFRNGRQVPPQVRTDPAASRPSRGLQPGRDLPAVSQLGDGWNTLHPGGETSCAHGDEFFFYARAADPDRLLVYLYGGGGCWNAESCDPARTDLYISSIQDARHPERSGGIFNLDHPHNPVADYSMVAIPVCTGDAYLGDRDATYTLASDSGDALVYTIRHRGQTNTMAVMQWIRSNFAQPADIVVAGSSAGSVGTPFYASLLARYYPSARVVGLGDDTGSFGSEAMAGSDPGSWGIPDVLRRHSGWEDFDGDAGQMYIHAVAATPDLELYQFDHAHDQTQRFWLEFVGVDDPDVLRSIRANRLAIARAVPGFRSFTAGGFAHTILRDNAFYQYHTDGHRLSDWLSAIVAGDTVPNVDCAGDCRRPGLMYTESDLRIIERALELISGSGAWDPLDRPGACPADAGRYSLRCALARAVREVTGTTPAGTSDLPAAAWDVIHTVTERLEYWGRGDVIRWYNNHPDTTVADMIAVLEEVRARIPAGLVESS